MCSRIASLLCTTPLVTCRSTLLSGPATRVAWPPDRSASIGTSRPRVGDHRCHDAALGWSDHELRSRDCQLVCPVRALWSCTLCLRCRVLDLMTSVLDSMASDHDALSFAVDSMTYVLAR